MPDPESRRLCQVILRLAGAWRVWSDVEENDRAGTNHRRFVAGFCLSDASGRRRPVSVHVQHEDLCEKH